MLWAFQLVSSSVKNAQAKYFSWVRDPGWLDEWLAFDDRLDVVCVFFFLGNKRRWKTSEQNLRVGNNHIEVKNKKFSFNHSSTLILTKLIINSPIRHRSIFEAFLRLKLIHYSKLTIMRATIIREHEHFPFQILLLIFIFLLIIFIRNFTYLFIRL